MLQPSNTLPNLKFCFWICSRACPDLKISMYIFWWYLLATWSWVMGEKFLFTKPIEFSLNRKIILCWWLFALKPIAGFCPFISYWPSKNASRDHGIKDVFVYLAKPIALGTIRKRILCWPILALEPIANFSTFLNYWTSKNGSCDPDVKVNLLLIQNL